MSKISTGSVYLDRDSSTSKRFASSRKKPFGVFLAGFFALVVLLLSVQPLVSSFNIGSTETQQSGNAAEAGALGFICSTNMGMFMDNKSKWNSPFGSVPQPHKKNRNWTLEEAFGGSTSFVNYEGEGAKDNPFIAEKPENKFKPGNYDKVYSKFETLRTFPNCGLNQITNGVASMIMELASVSTTLTKTFVVFAFDSSIICEDPVNPKGACLNLLKVIGGTGSSNGGLIGILTSSIYMPLLVIAVAITGVWVAHQGIVKRKIREAFSGALWMFLSVILGLAFLLNPTLLAKAPMAVSNSVAACIIGAFNGDNCMTNKSTGDSINLEDNALSSSANICKSSAGSVNMEERMSMTVNSLSCSIWKAFVLEPYAQGSFGTSFANLDTDSPQISEVIKKSGISPNKFCVNLGSTRSAESMQDKRLVLDRKGNRVCNILTYQMYLQTHSVSGDSSKKTPVSGATDTRWYNVAVVAANDEGLWNQWTGSITGGMHKMGIAGLALITSAVGGFILIVISFFALIYYISSLLLMAFAPLFLLIGIHPGRGKKIMLGWFEKIFSNIIKYLMSAAFLIVSIAIYGAVLGNATNMGVTLLFVFIISGALFLYRKEIMDLVGRVSMGGEQMSSALSERMGKSVTGVAKLAGTAVGAGAGAKLAGGRFASGAKDGIKRDLQRGSVASDIIGAPLGGLVSGAARQYNRHTIDGAQDVKTIGREAKQKHGEKKEELDELTETYNNESEAIERFELNLDAQNLDLEQRGTKEAKVESVNNDVARSMHEDNPFFAQAQLLLNQIKDLDLQRKVMLASGDVEGAAKAGLEADALREQRSDLLDAVPEEDMAKLNRTYNSRVREGLERASLGDYNKKDREEYEELSIKSARTERDHEVLVDSLNKLSERGRALNLEVAGLEERGKFYHDTDVDRQPGDDFTASKLKKINEESERRELSAKSKVDNSIFKDFESKKRYGQDSNNEGPDDLNRPSPETPIDPTNGGHDDLDKGNRFPDEIPSETKESENLLDKDGNPYLGSNSKEYLSNRSDIYFAEKTLEVSGRRMSDNEGNKNRSNYAENDRIFKDSIESARKKLDESRSPEQSEWAIDRARAEAINHNNYLDGGNTEAFDKAEEEYSSREEAELDRRRAQNPKDAQNDALPNPLDKIRTPEEKQAAVDLAMDAAIEESPKHAPIQVPDAEEISRRKGQRIASAEAFENKILQELEELKKGSGAIFSIDDGAINEKELALENVRKQINNYKESVPENWMSRKEQQANYEKNKASTPTEDVVVPQEDADTRTNRGNIPKKPNKAPEDLKTPSVSNEPTPTPEPIDTPRDTPRVNSGNDQGPTVNKSEEPKTKPVDTPKASTVPPVVSTAEAKPTEIPKDPSKVDAPRAQEQAPKEAPRSGDTPQPQPEVIPETERATLPKKPPVKKDDQIEDAKPKPQTRREARDAESNNKPVSEPKKDSPESSNSDQSKMNDEFAKKLADQEKKNSAHLDQATKGAQAAAQASDNARREEAERSYRAREQEMNQSFANENTRRDNESRAQLDSTISSLKDVIGEPGDSRAGESFDEIRKGVERAIESGEFDKSLVNKIQEAQSDIAYNQPTSIKDRALPAYDELLEKVNQLSRQAETDKQANADRERKMYESLSENTRQNNMLRDQLDDTMADLQSTMGERGDSRAGTNLADIREAVEEAISSGKVDESLILDIMDEQDRVAHTYPSSIKDAAIPAYDDLIETLQNINKDER